ncbi:helix-turn-helix transcriptional regulator [Prescottella equi]|uniref:helix-turn-helix transcriptional regulator n=1 Tax=Rhodococcus hoagii TaxID=43767 RepID=UPI0007CD8DFD|nr:helix-turn-helix transcriptional regulator [Prescottella equi]ORL11044.1 hypothetical protein A6I84_03445 [Prescottella equi]
MTNDDPDKGIGQVIQQLRVARDMSQAELAARIGEGFHQQTILKIEKGQRSLKLHEAVRVAEVFGVGVDALLISDGDALLAYQRIRRQIDSIRAINQDLARGVDTFVEEMELLRRAIRTHHYWSYEQKRELDHAYQEFKRNASISLSEYAREVDEIPDLEDGLDTEVAEGEDSGEGHAP